MKSLKIRFSDFYSDLNPNDNPFVRALSKRYDVSITNNPDFLFYSCFGTEFKKIQNCVRIFYTGENFVPNFNECDYAIGFNNLSFEDRYLRYNVTSALLSETLMHREHLNDSLACRKFCNFVYSNDTIGEGAVLRKQFCRKLMAYKQVDCPGKVLNNMTGGITPRLVNWENGKLEFLKQYKFTIAFENSSASGYTTEKMHHPLIANSIPIYWGNPNAAHDVNPNAFVNCHAFKSFDDVVDYIRMLDNDDVRYLDMLRQPAMQPTYNFNQDAELEIFLANIVEKGNVPFDKNPMGLPPDPNRNLLLSRIRRKARKLLKT